MDGTEIHDSLERWESENVGNGRLWVYFMLLTNVEIPAVAWRFARIRQLNKHDLFFSGPFSREAAISGISLTSRWNINLQQLVTHHLKREIVEPNA
jgi:hypothetical protein